MTGGLILLALAVVGLTRLRNRTSAAQRVATRALWVATAVNTASAVLRRDPRTPADAAAVESGSGTSPGNPRSALLIAGGLALILMAFLLPSGKEGAPDDPDEGPDAGPDAGPEDAA